MDSISNWYEKLIVPNLRRGDDEARAGFVRATLQVGRIAKAGKHVALHCLPHNENEERTVFPVPQAAHREKNTEVAEMANNPRIHEIIEDEVIYPAVVLLGK
jgi:hypothetical protein